MKITEQAIDRPRIVLVAAVLVALLAVLAIMELPVQREPNINKAVVMIEVPFPGAKSTEVDSQITRKLERALRKLQRVESVESNSFRELSTTTIFFVDGTDARECRNEVEHLVNEIRHDLPLGRDVFPTVTAIDFQSTPIMLVSIRNSSAADHSDFQRIAEEIRQGFELDPGVSRTELFGNRAREIRVTYDPGSLAQFGITLDGLRQSLVRADVYLPGGSLHSRGFDMQIRHEAQLRNVEDVRQIVVGQKSGRTLRLEDVANVEDTLERASRYAKIDGKACVTVIVHANPNINTLATAQSIKQQVQKYQAAFPDIELICTRDITREIHNTFWVLGSSVVFGAALVMLLLYFSMGFRISMLVILSIPLSTAIALGGLYAIGLPISNMVILSYVLITGMVVDGAIIVVENIYRHIERGEDPVIAAKKGIAEIAIPVFAADVTTLAAFAPMILIPGILGDFVGVIPKVVGLALLGSICVDHFLIPVVASWWFAPRRSPAARHACYRADSESKCLPPINGSTAPTRKRLTERIYERVLRWALANRWLVVVVSVCLIAWAILMIGNGVIALEFFPASDTGQFQINFELPLGSSIDETLQVSELITRPLEKLKRSRELLHYTTCVGPGGDLVGSWSSDPASGPEFGTVMVQLVSASLRQRSQNEIIAGIRDNLNPLPGVKYSIYSEEEGPTTGHDIELRISGNEYIRLGRLAEKLTHLIENMKGSMDAGTDFRPDNPELVIEPRPDVVGLFGMTETDVVQAVSTAIQGDSSIELIIDGKDVPLRLQAAREYRRYPDDLRRLTITSPAGRVATVGELASIRRYEGPFQVRRYNHRPTVSVWSDVHPAESGNGLSTDQFIERISHLLENDLAFSQTADAFTFLGEPNSPHDGIQIQFAGQHKDKYNDYHSLVKVLLLSTTLVTGLLIVQFNSIRQAAIVLVTVPLSAVGVVAGMWLCGFPFSLFSFIGLISLAGVVVNDAIVVMDFANQARRNGMTLHQSVMDAGCKRLRPIILTTITTIGGVLPLFLNLSGGAEFWQPLTGAIIFGLAFSSVLTVVVIPVLFTLLGTNDELEA